MIDQEGSAPSRLLAVVEIDTSTNGCVIHAPARTALTGDHLTAVLRALERAWSGDA